MFETLFEKYPFFRVIPCVLCMAVIFKLSSLTHDELQDFPQVWDKLAHFMEYATLSGCYAMIWKRNDWSKKTFLKVLILAGLCLLYGATDEFHQSFVEGRDATVLDLFADLFGGFFGGIVYVAITKILNKYDPV